MNPSGDGMSRTVDPARFRDPALRPIAEKVLAGRRLEPAEGLALYDTSDILSLGELAAVANERRNGDRVFFSANQHINPTNSSSFCPQASIGPTFHFFGSRPIRQTYGRMK